MRLSRYFLPILRENPKEAEIVSHRLMLRAGMIRQEAAGIYAWLPLGFRVLQKIEQIVREEMDRAGAIELLMPTLQLADLWRETGRYDAYGPEMLRIKDRHERELLYGPTNEEMITEIFRASVRSYSDLPKNLYHIQWKFRDEQRPRFGVMRGREFLMKDAYSFDVDEAAARRSYQRMFVAYLRIFARMGLKAIPMRAETGPIGGDLSHEFIILAETGESGVFINADVLDLPIPPATTSITMAISRRSSISGRTLYAATEDVHDAARFERETPPEKRIHTRGIEVGQVFYFGDKYSKPMKAVVTGPDGVERPVSGGSYGVGVSRLRRRHHRGQPRRGRHHLAGGGGAVSSSASPISRSAMRRPTRPAEKIYDALEKAGIDVLYDDTDERPGAKFATLDLIGLPYQIIVGPKGLAEGKVEVKTRSTAPARTCCPSMQSSTSVRPVDALPASRRSTWTTTFRPFRMDDRDALSASAALQRLRLRHCRLFLPRHHAGRRDADRRHVGHEWLPQRTAQQDRRHQRPYLPAGGGYAAHRLQQRGQGGRESAGCRSRHPNGRRLGFRIVELRPEWQPALSSAASRRPTSGVCRASPTMSALGRSKASTLRAASPSASGWPKISICASATRSRS